MGSCGSRLGVSCWLPADMLASACSGCCCCAWPLLEARLVLRRPGGLEPAREVWGMLLRLLCIPGKGVMMLLLKRDRCSLGACCCCCCCIWNTLVKLKRPPRPWEVWLLSAVGNSVLNTPGRPTQTCQRQPLGTASWELHLSVQLQLSRRLGTYPLHEHLQWVSHGHCHGHREA